MQATPELAEELAKHPDGDRYTLRFLRATMGDRHGKRVFDVASAEARIKDTLQFRKAMKLDDVRKRIEAGDFPADYLVYRDKVRPRYSFIDPTTGRYIVFERMGVLANTIDVNGFTEEEWTRHIAWDLEERMHILRTESKRRGYEVSMQTVVMDLKNGPSFAGLLGNRVGLLKMLTRIAATHFPELMCQIILPNAPCSFSFLRVRVVVPGAPKNAERLTRGRVWRRVWCVVVAMDRDLQQGDGLPLGVPRPRHRGQVLHRDGHAHGEAPGHVRRRERAARVRRRQPRRRAHAREGFLLKWPVRSRSSAFPVALEGKKTFAVAMEQETSRERVETQ